MENEFITQCGCGTHFLKVEKWDDTYMMNSFYMSRYYSLWDRIKMAFNIIRGIHINTDEIILNEDQMEKFYNNLGKLKNGNE